MFNWFKKAPSAPQPEILAIPNYYGESFTILQERLTWMTQPVFAHPKTGEPSTSLYALDRILGLGLGDKWGASIDKLYLLAEDGDLFLRRDLPKKNPQYPTICISLRSAERLVTEAWPRKGKKAYEKLRQKNSAAAPSLSLVA